MVRIEELILAYKALGKKFDEVILYLEGGKKHMNNESCIQLIGAIEQEIAKSTWYIKEDVIFNLKAINANLTSDILKGFSNRIPQIESKEVALLLNSTMPFFGFYELITLLFAKSKIQLKFYTQEAQLLIAIVDVLLEICPVLEEYISIEQQAFREFDLLIMSSSTLDEKSFLPISSKKTSKHFFIYPKENIGVITHDVSEDELKELANDLFLNFGRTKYNIKKLYIPEDFQLEKLFVALELHNYRSRTHRYANMYDYSKFTCQMNRKVYYDINFCIFLESAEKNTAIGQVNFIRYKEDELLQEINNYKVENTKFYGDINMGMPFGNANCLSLQGLPEINQIINILEETE